MNTFNQLLKIFLPRYFIIIGSFFGLFFLASLAGTFTETQWNPSFYNIFTYIIINLLVGITIGYFSIRNIIKNKNRTIESVFVCILIPAVLISSVFLPLISMAVGGIHSPNPYAVKCNNNKLLFINGINGADSVFLDQGLKIVRISFIRRDIATSRYYNPEFNDKATQELKDCVNKKVGIN